MAPLFGSLFEGTLFDATGFPPRWSCGAGWQAQPALGWVHVVADVMIFGAYLSIPLALAFFIRRRRDLPFAPIFWMFVLFICSCGLGHLIEAFIFWHPVYRLSAFVKVVTAVASWATVLVLVPILPRALALPGLAATNEALKREIRDREEAEARLSESVDELNAFTRHAVDREERMMELKREVNTLRAELGRGPKYDPKGGRS